MAITSSIARHYALRMHIIAIVCVVLGVWGIYDYGWKIPKAQKKADQAELLDACKTAVEAEYIAGPLSADALEQVEAALARLDEAGGDDDPNDEQWRSILTSMQEILKAPRPEGRLTSEAHQEQWDRMEAYRTSLGPAEPPGRFDRVMQWMFILCLPFAPYFWWVIARTRRRVYHLDDGGTLEMPEGTWKPEEIADIDMSRWMAKSIAHVVHRDGTRVKLDAYLHKDLHLIVGAIASEKHPDQWDAEAKPVKTPEAEQPHEPDGADRPTDPVAEAGEGDSAGDASDAGQERG